MNQKMDERSLEIVTKEILGEKYYEDIYNFLNPFLYNELKSASEKKIDKIVIFVTRRLSCMADIYIRIRGEKYSAPPSYRYLTNTALINAAYPIAEMILNGEAPDIQVVDDSIAYGRAIVNILNIFKDSLIAAFQTMGKDAESAEESTQKYIKDHVSIHVFLGKDHITLLPRAYQDKLTVSRRVNNSIWNDFSNRVSELINNVDVANAAFVLSVGTDIRPTACKGWEFVKTTYQQKKEWVFFKRFGTENGLKAMASIRCYRCGAGKPYRMVPFIFMPQLDEEQLSILEDRSIFSKLQYPISLDKEIYRKKRAARSRKEFLTMYFSHSLLLDFWKLCETNDPDKKEELKDFDIDKVRWNYDDLNAGEHNRKALFDQKNMTNSDYWQSTSVIQNIFEDKNKEIGLKNIEIPLDYFTDEAHHTPKQEKQFIKSLEEFLFDRGIESEASAYDLISKSFYPSPWQSAAVDPDRRHPLESFLNELLQNYVLKMLPTDNIYHANLRNVMPWDDFISKYGIKKEDIQIPISFTKLLAYLLQIMDAGLIAIIERVKEEDAYERTNMEHLSLEQQVRICEQAMGILFKRYYWYLDVLESVSMKFDWVDYKDYEDILEYRIRPILEQFIETLNNSSDEITVKNKKISVKDALKQAGGALECNDMLLFLNSLKQASQKVGYWIFGMNRHFYIDEASVLKISSDASFDDKDWLLRQKVSEIYQNMELIDI